MGVVGKKCAACTAELRWPTKFQSKSEKTATGRPSEAIDYGGAPQTVRESNHDRCDGGSCQCRCRK